MIGSSAVARRRSTGAASATSGHRRLSRSDVPLLAEAEEIEWEGYFRAVEGRTLREVFVEALPLLPTASQDERPLVAVDLGWCGDGKESLELLALGPPLRAPEQASARTLAKGHTRSGRAVLYTLSTPWTLLRRRSSRRT